MSGVMRYLSLRSVTNLTSEGAAAWLSYSTNIISSVAAALPALTTLTTALTAKAAAEAAGSAAVTPVVGWINAIAAISAIMSAMASIPKFADGGIIGGKTTLGDMNIARVNKGEMILNGTQQKRLFSILDGGVSASSNNITSGNVKFEIKGSTLVGVLKNHNSKMNKVG